MALRLLQHLFLFCWLSHGLFGWDYQDRYGQVYSIDLFHEKELGECETVFINSFSATYRDYSEEDLGIPDKNKFLRESFQELGKDLQNGAQKLLVAKYQGRVVGFACFQQVAPGRIYISQLSVEPDFWRCGIGSQLVFGVFKVYDDVKSIVVQPRKINRVARDFYHSLGFTECSYIHQGYNRNNYIGYEWLAP